MIGVRLGLRIGPKLGLAIGTSADQLGGADPLAGVTRDAASGKYFPATNAEWTIVMAVAGIASGNPTNIWNCQDASGALVDANATLNLAATGTANYQQAVTGYSRLKVANPTDGSGIRFTAVGSDIATVSQLLFGVFDMPTANPGGTRTYLEMGTATDRAAIETLNTGVTRAASKANVASGTDGKTAVRPLTIGVNRTNSTVRGTSDQDKLLPTFDGTMTGTLLNLWGVAAGNLSPICGTLYLVRFTGAAAELTDAQLKTLHQTLNWSIPWS